MRRRVAITGVGLTSPIGGDLDAVSDALRAGRHGVARCPEWAAVHGLQTRLVARVEDAALQSFPRKKVRSMGRLGLLSLLATERALDDAGLDREALRDGRHGIAYGSTHGSSEALTDFCRRLFTTDSLDGISGSAYLKFMSHTCVANLAQYYGVRGRVVSTCAACVSGSVAVGTGYELVRAGVQRVMLCGGAEEAHFVPAAVFDTMLATSRAFNDRPDESPRPFDADRDGLVVGEGAGTLVLEPLDEALARGARVYAEVLGYGSSCDGTHVTAPDADGMRLAMELCLQDAGITADEVDYVNAHATATEVGDHAEAAATHAVFGARVPVSSTKGHTGHTLGACGALELAFCVAMMRGGFIAPTRNLRRVDPRLAPLDHVMGAAREARLRVVMSNNFAFGGMNTSILLRAL
ncbi:MAG: beta-ketoacyl-ACP synthase [Polyangiales bacterium]